MLVIDSIVAASDSLLNSLMFVSSLMANSTNIACNKSDFDDDKVLPVTTMVNISIDKRYAICSIKFFYNGEIPCNLVMLLTSCYYGCFIDVITKVTSQI